MADSSIPITGGAGYNVDTRTATNGDHREVVVIGDATTDNVAKVGVGGDRLSSISSPEMAPFGIGAKISPDSKLWTTTDPNTIFTEAFDAGTLDTQRWTQSGTVAPAFLSGSLAIAPGTANSASTVLSSVPAFQPNGIGFEMFGTVITLEAAKITTPNVHRFWGVGQVTSYTSATPLTDGAGYEVGIDGELNCVCYVGGTRYVVNSTLAANISSSVAGMGGSGTAAPTGAGLTNFGAVLTWPGNTKRYFMQYRPDSVIWYIDSLTKPVASATYVNPNVSALPVRLAAVTTPATSTVSSAVVFTVAGCAVSDSTKQNQLLSDPIYPWRKAGVGKNGGLSVKGSSISGVSNPVAASTTATIGPVDVAEAGNVTFTIKSTAPAVPYTGAPVVMFEQSDDGTSWSPLLVVRSDTGVPAATHVLPAGALNGALMFDSALEGVNYVRARLTTGSTANGITVAIQPGGLSFSPLVSAFTTPLPAATSAVTSVTAAASDTSLLSANALRKGASVFNDSTATLYLSLAATAASTTAFTIKLAAGAYYEIPFAYSGAVRGIWSAANGAARVTEMTA